MSSDVLVEFVKDARKAGKNLAETREVLIQSGWEPARVSEALSRFVDRDFPVAVPKPIVYASPRLTFLNLFHFLVLYLSTYHVVATLFTLLDFYLPDGLGRRIGFFYNYGSIGEALRDHIAVIVVGVPLVYLSNIVIQAAIFETKQAIPQIRLKLIYLTMFIGACVMLGNGICFVHYFLAGELSIRFMIKLGILSLLALAGFVFFKLETKDTEKQI